MIRKWAGKPIIVMPKIILCYAYLLFSKASSLLNVDDRHEEMHHKTEISCEIRIFICDTFSSIKCALWRRLCNKKK